MLCRVLMRTPRVRVLACAHAARLTNLPCMLAAPRSAVRAMQEVEEELDAARLPLAAQARVLEASVSRLEAAAARAGRAQRGAERSDEESVKEFSRAAFALHAALRAGEAAARAPVGGPAGGGGGGGLRGARWFDALRVAPKLHRGAKAALRSTSPEAGPSGCSDGSNVRNSHAPPAARRSGGGGASTGSAEERPACLGTTGSGTGGMRTGGGRGKYDKPRQVPGRLAPGVGWEQRRPVLAKAHARSCEPEGRGGNGDTGGGESSSDGGEGSSWLLSRGGRVGSGGGGTTRRRLFSTSDFAGHACEPCRGRPQSGGGSGSCQYEEIDAAEGLPEEGGGAAVAAQQLAEAYRELRAAKAAAAARGRGALRASSAG